MCNICRQKEKSVFSNAVVSGSINHIPGQAPCPGAIGQDKTKCLFVLEEGAFDFLFGIFVYLTFLFLFISLFFKRKGGKKHKGRSEVHWGREKYSKNTV